MASSPPKTFEFVNYGEALAAYVKEQTDPDRKPISLGWPSVDDRIRRLSTGQVLAFAGRTFTGKTWALLSIVHNFAPRKDSGCLLVSLEMPVGEVAERQFAIHAGVSPEQVEEWARGGHIIQRARAFAERYENVLLFGGAMTLRDLPEAIRQAKERLARRNRTLRLILIDYLSLLQAQGRDVYERASAVGAGLKPIALSENVAIVAATQLSRAGGDGSEPVTASMLRDSGVIEESVDVILGAWQPGRKASLTPAERLALQDVLRVAVLKARRMGSGGRDVVDLRFARDSRLVYEPEDAWAPARESEEAA
jgi:replicative DNA helicase